MFDSPSTRIEDWEIAGELMEHDDRLRSYLEEKEPEYNAERNTGWRTKAVQTAQAVKAQDSLTDGVIEAAERRLRGSHPDGFAYGDARVALSGNEKRILRNNGSEIGSPPLQIITHLATSGAITWEGRENGASPGRRTIYKWDEN